MKAWYNYLLVRHVKYLNEIYNVLAQELDRQVLLMDESETKVDRTTADLKNTNVRLKETLFKVRSTRNFIIDIILLCVLLGIVAILQNFFCVKP
ncbi:hypothetical protein QQ045_004347 [Rhodiola kirilowii]